MMLKSIWGNMAFKVVNISSVFSGLPDINNFYY